MEVTRGTDAQNNKECKPPILTKSEKQLVGAGKGDAVRAPQKNRYVMDLRYDLIFGSEKQKKEAKEKLKEIGDL